MVKISALALAAGLAGSTPAPAQVHDGIDQPPAQQRTADEFRATGSKCDAPACRDEVDGIYPPSTRPGEAASTPSIPASHLLNFSAGLVFRIP